MTQKGSIYWIKVYWVGAMTQMFVTCVVLFLFRKFNISTSMENVKKYIMRIKRNQIII